MNFLVFLNEEKTYGKLYSFKVNVIEKNKVKYEVTLFKSKFFSVISPNSGTSFTPSYIGLDEEYVHKLTTAKTEAAFLKLLKEGAYKYYTFELDKSYTNIETATEKTAPPFKELQVLIKDAWGNKKYIKRNQIGGLEYRTKAGISLSINDLGIPVERRNELKKAKTMRAFLKIVKEYYKDAVET